jgi:hypothetical protein
MFTAKINRKEDRGGIVEIFVDFTNGVDTYTDSCKPQNREGYEYWVRSKLETYNASEVLKTELVDGATIDVSDPVVTPPTLTQAEIDRDTWLTKYRLWVRVKTTLIDTGVIAIDSTRAAAMLADLKTTLRPEYIDFI